jgi:outer membrane lipoprotein-sorting protein
MFKIEQIQQVDDFIEDLIKEKKPRAYSTGPVDREMEKMFETIRAVKRLKESLSESKTAQSFPRTGLFKTRLFKGLVASAAALLLAIGLFNLSGVEDVNIVHAVVKAYQELQSYSGTAEIRSERNGEVEFLETIEIQYKKPFQYSACHRYNGYEVRYVSDGEKLAVIEPSAATVENVFPEKELWRYHIGTSVWELQKAEEVNVLGTEALFGRETTVLEYRFIGDSVWHQVWIDKATNLPLRKILNHPEESVLVVEFQELQINPPLSDDLFTWILTDDIEVRELNRAGTLEEVTRFWPAASRLPGILPPEMELKKAGILQNDLYEYVLRFRGFDEKDFVDVFYTSKPGESPSLPGAESGTLAGGRVYLAPRAWNVFENYFGESTTARWITDNAEVFIVSSRDISELGRILEELAGEEIVQRAAPEEGTIELYFMKVTDTSFELDLETRSVDGRLGARELLEELLKGPQDQSLSRIIPEETRLLDVRVENGIAYADFSAEITKGNFGAGTEGVLVSSIVWTLTQFEEIEAVQILVEGQVLESLAGHVSISEPLRR